MVADWYHPPSFTKTWIRPCQCNSVAYCISAIDSDDDDNAAATDVDDNNEDELW